MSGYDVEKFGTEEQLAAELDSMDYEKALRLIRHAEVGHPFFIMEHPLQHKFSEIYYRLKKEISGEEHSAISKKIGW